MLSPLHRAYTSWAVASRGADLRRNATRRRAAGALAEWVGVVTLRRYANRSPSPGPGPSPSPSPSPSPIPNPSPSPNPNPNPNPSPSPNPNPNPNPNLTPNRYAAALLARVRLRGLRGAHARWRDGGEGMAAQRAAARRGSALGRAALLTCGLRALLLWRAARHALGLGSGLGLG
jgi:hypothetical protein